MPSAAPNGGGSIIGLLRLQRGQCETYIIMRVKKDVDISSGFIGVRKLWMDKSDILSL